MLSIQTAVSFVAEAPGSQRAAGMENIAHHIPLRLIARRRENVLPFIWVTGMRVRIRRAIPAPYPT